MRQAAWIALLVGVLGGAARAEDGSAPEEKPRELRVGVGGQKVLTIRGTRRVSVGDPSVLDVKPLDRGQLMLIGLSPGRTTLMVWFSETAYLDYQVAVGHDFGVSGGPMDDVRTLLGEMEGVSVRLVGDRIFLDGMTFTRADTERVSQVVACYPTVVNLVRAAPASRRSVATRMSTALARAGLRTASVTVIGDTYFLEGSVESESDRARAESIARAVLEAESAAQPPASSAPASPAGTSDSSAPAAGGTAH